MLPFRTLGFQGRGACQEPEDAAAVVRVQLCHLRKKLRAQGSSVTIGTVHGRGLVAVEVVG